MKITQAEPKFKPVVITLESQKEVDALYLVGRHSFIRRALGASDVMRDLMDGLEAAATTEATGQNSFNKFDNTLSALFNPK